MHILTIPLLLVHIFKNSVSYSFFIWYKFVYIKSFFFSHAIFSKAVALYFLSPFLIYLHFLWAISHSSGVYNLLSLSYTDELILFFFYHIFKLLFSFGDGFCCYSAYLLVEFVAGILGSS